MTTDKVTNDITLHPIGIIRTPLNKQGGAPRQPKFAGDIEGVIEIYPQYREGLSDVDGFERIWLLFWCHEAAPYKLKVVPYRDVVLRGVFATRAPSRPNSLGLSVVRVMEVDVSAGILKVAGVDMLDGTPIIDIKPYSPEFDCFPNSKEGWLDRVSDKSAPADDRFARKDNTSQA